MPISLKPEALGGNGKAIAGGAGGMGLGGLIVYLALEVLSAREPRSQQAVREPRSQQAVIDARQDMRIEYNLQGTRRIERDLKEVKRNQRKILDAIAKLDR